MAPVQKVSTAEPQTIQRAEAKLTIETPPPLTAQPAMVEEKRPDYQLADPGPKTTTGNGLKAKISSLDTLRNKIAAASGQPLIADKPLEELSLKAAWKTFIEQLKEQKRPAWQSYELAELVIKDDACFDVVVTNRINEKFIELERKDAGEFLQHQLSNRLLQFTITLIEAPKNEAEISGAPLSKKEQFIKLVEQYPIILELKDRLKLDLDY